HEPLLTAGVDDDRLAVLRDDAPALLVIKHGVVWRSRMDVALVAADRPGADVLQFLAAVLNAGVVAGLFDLGVDLEVFHRAAAPDEELVIGQHLGIGGDAGEATVLHRPVLGIAIPTGEVFAVEQGFEAGVVGSGNEGGAENEAEQGGKAGVHNLMSANSNRQRGWKQSPFTKK